MATMRPNSQCFTPSGHQRVTAVFLAGYVQHARVPNPGLAAQCECSRPHLQPQCVSQFSTPQGQDSLSVSGCTTGPFPVLSECMYSTSDASAACSSGLYAPAGLSSTAVSASMDMASKRRALLSGLLAASLLIQRPVQAADSSPPGSSSNAPAAAPRPAGPAPAVAFPAPPPSEDPQVAAAQNTFTYSFTSDVPANLRVKEYWLIITRNRPSVWQQIAGMIATGEFVKLSLNLTVASVADMRQAALYLSWALLQNNEYNAAIDARKAYLGFDEQLNNLQRVSIATASASPNDAGAQAQQVQQAFLLVSAALDGLLASIPARYLT